LRDRKIIGSRPTRAVSPDPVSKINIRGKTSYKFRR
jgi:hypothetical protein